LPRRKHPPTIDQTHKITIHRIDEYDSSVTSAPTLDQLAVFAAVVDCGSFSAAARRLNRAQSVISYTVAGLEAQLGLALFARGQRRPVLTEAGRAMLADARRVIGTMEDLRARAAALTQGLEAELALAVDVMFPTDRLVGAIEDFARTFPTVALRLRMEALGGTTQLVMDGECGLGITGGYSLATDSLWRRTIGGAELVAVVAPTHPLAAIVGPIPSSALREHVQLVLSDRTKLTEGRDFGVLSPRTWRLGDLGAKHALLRAGLGWGRMPEAMIRDDLRDGKLAPLDVDERERPVFPFMLIRRADAPAGPASRWLAERFHQDCGEVATSLPAA
jgi:DNA-binding transcriptional LysR family regulator